MTISAGYKGKMVVDGTEVAGCIAEFSVTPAITTTKVRCKGVNGKYPKVVDQGSECQARWKHYWEADDDVTEDPPNFQAGAVLSNVQFFPDRDANRHYFITELLVVRAPFTSPEEGAATYECEGEASGHEVHEWRG